MKFSTEFNNERIEKCTFVNSMSTVGVVLFCPQCRLTGLEHKQQEGKI